MNLRAPRVPRALRSVAAPVLAAVCTLALLALWVGAGQAGVPGRVTVSDGRVYRPILDDRQMTALFFTVTNEATAGDELIAVDAGEVGETMFSDHVHLSEGSGRMVMTDSITFAPEQTLAMTAFTQNIMVHLKRPLELGEELDFTLVFRQAGEVRASAVVVRHGE